MRELLDPGTVERVLITLAIAGPLVGGAVGAFLGRGQEDTLPQAIAGAFVGGSLTLVYGLWRLYNVITEALGLDSVANLALQVALFAIIGIAIGWAVARLNLLLKRPKMGEDSSKAHTE